MHVVCLVENQTLRNTFDYCMKIFTNCPEIFFKTIQMLNDKSQQEKIDILSFKNSPYADDNAPFTGSRIKYLYIRIVI